MTTSIRQLTESNWQELSAIRLKALQTDPSVFGSNYESESKLRETHWRKWFDPAGTAIFMIFDGTRGVGMTCISVYRDDPTNRTAIMWGRGWNQGLRAEFVGNHVRRPYKVGRTASGERKDNRLAGES